MNECDCTRGGPCNKTTLCAVEAAVEDAVNAHEEVAEMAKAYIEIRNMAHHGPVSKDKIAEAYKDLANAVLELQDLDL